MYQRRVFVLLLSVLTVFTFCVKVYAHPGGTDSSGGHRDSSTGEYHYHHGYSAHDHHDMDRDGDVDCPYDFDDKTNHAKSSSTQTFPKIENKKISFWDLVSALIISIGPALGISLLGTLILVNLFCFIFGDDIGWTITKITFFIFLAITCYYLVDLKLA